jgi:Flp pilus assembly protein TadD
LPSLFYCVRPLLLALLLPLAAIAQVSDPVSVPLEKAYAALRDQSYEAAIEQFHLAIEQAPKRASIRKDLAYTYVKVGEPEAAQAQFAEAMKLDPEDAQVALEYAFLANDLKETAKARRIFDHWRKKGNATAEQGFQNIDRALAEGIARWRKAVDATPDNFSAHEELARLAAQRDELELAATSFERAFALKPDRRDLLIELARVYDSLGRTEPRNAALIAASRCEQPRVAEAARERLPERYPYVYEFQNALKLDPTHTALRRELAYLHLAMGNKADAEAEFRVVTKQDPEDMLSAAQLGFLLLGRNEKEALPLLEKAMHSTDKAVSDRVKSVLKPAPKLQSREELPRSSAAAMGDSSFRAGYFKDAVQYLRVAFEDNPEDGALALKLGWTYNMLREDAKAMPYFKKAALSSDPRIAAEAQRAIRNLAPSQARVQSTFWTLPLYSSRWKSGFSYSQWKTEFKVGGLPIRPYLSARIVGDTRGEAEIRGFASPQYLSESSLIVGLGVRTSTWKGVMAWAEAGQAIRYRQRNDVGRMIPDYRGGINFSRSFGRNLGAEGPGIFFETLNDGIFVSRFNNNVLLYSQNHIGYTMPKFGPLEWQLFWNANLTKDYKNEGWANFGELGPGLKFRVDGMPKSLALTVSMLKGTYLQRDANPNGPHFTDLRAGIWYAFTR